MKKWIKNTINISSTHQMMEHQEYSKLIDMGVDIIPLIFTKMDDNPILCFLLLSEITGDDPVHKKDRGKISAMKEAWRKWAMRYSKER